MNSNAFGLILIVIIILAVLGVFLFAPSGFFGSSENATTTPSGGQPTTTPNQGGTSGTSTQPLNARVSVASPAAGATVGKTFTVTGSAPGPWYFEASFPVEVRDAQNERIAQTFATAQGEWMTTDNVPFTSTVTITGTYTGPATLVLLRDNPSGLPENDDSVSIPIVIQ